MSRAIDLLYGRYLAYRARRPLTEPRLFARVDESP